MLHKMSYGPDKRLENKCNLSCVSYVLSTIRRLFHLILTVTLLARILISLLQIMLRRLGDISEVDQDHTASKRATILTWFSLLS